MLAILSTGPFEFFYTMRLLDHGREKLDSRHDMAEQSFPTLVLSCSGVFSEEVDASFQRLLGEVLALCHHMLKDKLLSSARERKVDDRQGRLFP